VLPTDAQEGLAMAFLRNTSFSLVRAETIEIFTKRVPLEVVQEFCAAQDHKHAVKIVDLNITVKIIRDVPASGNASDMRMPFRAWHTAHEWLAEWLICRMPAAYLYSAIHPLDEGSRIEIKILNRLSFFEIVLASLFVFAWTWPRVCLGLDGFHVGKGFLVSALAALAYIWLRMQEDRELCQFANQMISRLEDAPLASPERSMQSPAIKNRVTRFFEGAAIAYLEHLHVKLELLRAIGIFILISLICLAIQGLLSSSVY
jgi:hypothetical protein